MTMVAPKTFAAGEVLTAADLNSHVTGAYPTVLQASVDAGGFNVTALDELAFNNAAANASAAGRVRRNANDLTWGAGGTAGRLFYAGGTDVPVADGGTGLSSGTSGGVLGYTAAGTIASSVALTASAIVLGGGAGATPTSMTGTSGGVVYFNATTTVASSGLLTASAIVLGGGAGAAPTSMTGTSGGVVYFDSATTVASSGALTARGVVLGGGAGAAPTSLGAMTNGQLVIGSTGANPVVAALTAGSNITVTNAAGAITIAASGGLTRVDGNTTEATTTATTTTAMITLSALSVAAATPILVTWNWRKTAPGTASTLAFNLDVNATTDVVVNARLTGNENTARNGSAMLLISPRVTSYLQGILLWSSASTNDQSAVASYADMPTATVTQLVLRAHNGGGGGTATIGYDEVHAYSLATS